MHRGWVVSIALEEDINPIITRTVSIATQESDGGLNFLFEAN